MEQREEATFRDRSRLGSRPPGPARVQDLIATWCGGELDRFLGSGWSPVLIGLGVLDHPLLRPGGIRTTHAVAPVAAVAERVRPSPTIAGVVFPMAGRAGPEQTRVLLGRSAECDVVLPEPSISERHCAAELCGESCSISDLGSTNGTSVNGAILAIDAPRRLADEDVVTLGRCSFLYFTPRSLFCYLQLQRP